MAVEFKDVVIAGGGLAGLGLAQQLSTLRPELNIAVVEKSQFPIDRTTPKVGESTVEIASRYMVDSLGLDQHFKDQHLQKFGLRCFFGAAQTDFSGYDELGASNRFPIATYQLERGVLENHLFDTLRSAGATLNDGAQITGASIEKHQHRMNFVDAQGESREYQSRWLIDCSGRFGMLKRHLGLAKPSEHKGNALWFRVDRTVKIDDWSGNQDWHQRVALEGKRWLSTNHLMGPGYWVWIIPLGGGATSVGVVMDDEAWAAAGLTDMATTMAWLETHHPQLADAIDGADVMDFVALKDYSFDCKRLFSDQGWGISGEAGVFADPFYSPGSDFIAMANDILSHLIVADSHGQDIALDSRVMDAFFRSFFSNTLSLYRGQYGGWGDRTMMSAKLLWDYIFYWGVLALLYYRKAITDAALLRSLNPTLVKAMGFNNRMQQHFRDRAAQRRVLPVKGLFFDQYKVPVLDTLIHQLDDDTVPVQNGLSQTVKLMENVMPLIVEMLGKGSLQRSDIEKELLGDYWLNA